MNDKRELLHNLGWSKELIDAFLEDVAVAEQYRDFDELPTQLSDSSDLHVDPAGAVGTSQLRID